MLLWTVLLTIDISLNRIYYKKDLAANVELKDMSDLILLRAKIVHFTFNKKIYKEPESAAKDPVLAGVMMVELGYTMVSRLSNHLYFWTRYVDDTFTFVKEDSITFILEKFSSYYQNLQFTYELENVGKFSFLDVLDYIE